MEFLSELWLPILVSAALVWIVSAIIHMLMPWHKSEWKGARYISGTWDPKPTREQKTTILYRAADIPAGA